MILQSTRHTNPRCVGPESGLTVIVATYRRPQLLEKLLVSLRTEIGVLREVVVVSPHAGGDIEAALARQVEHLPMLRCERSPSAAKSVGLNAAIRATDGSFLAFLDDDTEVVPGWGAAFMQHFQLSGAAAYQGRISPPAQLLEQPRSAEVVRSFMTHPFRDSDSPLRRCRGLTGANCAVHRDTFERVGTFDERLGPGAAGACEDTDMGFRIGRAGGKIVYVPTARVVHGWFPERATEEYHVEYIERRARSRWLMNGRPAWPRMLGDMLWTHVADLVSRASSDQNVRLHTRSKRIHYLAMWKCAIAARRMGQGAR